MKMSSETVWWVIFLAGLGTFFWRYSFFAAFGGQDPPEWLRRGLRFVPASVLSALVAPAVVLSGLPAFTPANPRLWAGVFAALVAWRTKNVLATIAAGMGGLWAIQWMIGAMAR
jgi:branched-subunit amino acid transport protein